MNAIYKFADNTTVVGQISNIDESKYRSQIEGLVTWCNENNLSLNVGKTKELIIDLRKKGGEHAPIYVNRTEVERVESIKFLRVLITDNLSWTSHVNATVKKAQQHLFFLRQLRKFCMSDYKKLQNVACTAEPITEANLPSMDCIYTACCCRKVANIIKDPCLP
eukprot:g17666.t1